MTPHQYTEMLAEIRRLREVCRSLERENQDLKKQIEAALKHFSRALNTVDNFIETASCADMDDLHEAWLSR
jgi:hypothetical protein